MGSKEPMVPLVVFNQMNNNLMRLIEQEGKARREQEERIAKLFGNFADKIAETVVEALKPPVLLEPADGPIHMNEDEEDLRYAHSIGQVDKTEFKSALEELQFHLAGGQIELG